MDLNNRRTGKAATKPRALGLLGHSVVGYKNLPCAKSLHEMIEIGSMSYIKYFPRLRGSLSVLNKNLRYCHRHVYCTSESEKKLLICSLHWFRILTRSSFGVNMY